MTGREGGAEIGPVGENTPAVILVRPQLAENIGAAARAMAARSVIGYVRAHEARPPGDQDDHGRLLDHVAAAAWLSRIP